MMNGFLALSWSGYLIAALILTQITIASVTIYLHRHQTHRALTLHPIVSHFFRFWLWLTTGMVTAEWVAIHRKHHAKVETEEDPHSPVVLGLSKVLWQGAMLYHAAAKDKSMIEQYSYGTPKDWMERKLYTPLSRLGILIMLGLDIFLFGLPGVLMWIVQMVWIPFWAAGVINGVGHSVGYRNYECEDNSSNIVPWGLWIGGEELHNNHHTFASSAKFSVKWWEFDIGWFYIRCLSALGLAKVKTLAPQLMRDTSKQLIDMETVKAVIANRFQVMSDYYLTVIKPVLKRQDCLHNSEDKKLLKRASVLLKKQEDRLSGIASNRLKDILNRFQELQLVYSYRQSLQQIWSKTLASQQELVEALQVWCQQAENSGLDVLQRFSMQMKSYTHSNWVFG